MIVHGGHVADDNDIDKWASSAGALDWLETEVPVYLEKHAGGDVMARRAGHHRPALGRHRRSHRNRVLP